jgi:hypothetical protein
MVRFPQKNGGMALKVVFVGFGGRYVMDDANVPVSSCLTCQK